MSERLEKDHKLTRREFLKSTPLIFATLLTACQIQPAETKVIYVWPDGSQHDFPPPAAATDTPSPSPTGTTQPTSEATATHTIPDTPTSAPIDKKPYWQTRSIDTMKVSRDMGGQLLESVLQKGTDERITFMIEKVKKANANVIAYGTPYDEEFIPLLEVEIAEAEKAGLGVWLRGNFSGFQEERDANGPTGHGWFNHPLLKSPEEHHTRTRQFILDNKHLFISNDGKSRVAIFSPAPEPENGLIGDPRTSPQTKQLFDEWLVDSYSNARRTLNEIGATDTKVIFSFNGDVAKILPDGFINDKNPLLADHYIKDPQQYPADIQELHDIYNAPVGLGEVGAPIPDIHGPMTEVEQAEHVRQILTILADSEVLVPIINYWHLWNPYDEDQNTATSLLNADGTERQVYEVIQEFFEEE